MRVMFILHDADRNNGANHSMMDLIDYFASHSNVQPILVFPKKEGSAINYAKSKGYEVITTRFGRWDFPLSLHGIRKIKYGMKWCIKLLCTIPAYYKLKNYIVKNNVSVLYTNTYTTFIGAILSKNLNLPHIWHIREFGKEDHNYRNVFGDKLVYDCIDKYSDSVIFISNSLKDKYIPHISQKEKCVVIYNDIMPPISTVDINEKWKSKHVDLLIAGTIQEGKGQLEAIKAIEVLHRKYGFNDITLTIAGRKAGEYYKKIENYVRANNLNNHVAFAGFVADMESLRRKSQIGIVASSKEAFGRVTVEGMLSGMLMIGADEAGTHELIVDGESGYLYRLHDIEQLADILRQAITAKEKSKTIAQNGLDYAIRTFGSNIAAKRIEQIILNLCELR